MTFIYCNTPATVVKTCEGQRLLRALLVGFLIFFVQGTRAEVPPKSAAVAIAPVATEEESDDALYVALTGSVGNLQSNNEEKAKLSEQQRDNPSDRAVAAQIKAID